jgi:hypothetical protein
MKRILVNLAAQIEKEVSASRGVRSVFLGDPIIFAKNDLPAISISPIETRTETFDSASDKKISQISISATLDARKYFGKSAREKSGLSEVLEIMEDDDENGNLENNTILAAVRRFFAAENLVLKTESEKIDYGFKERDFPTIEAILTFSVHGIPHSRI